MKKLLLIFGGIAGFSTMSAQSFSPQVTASAGTSMSSGSVAIEFTIGAELRFEVLTNTVVSVGVIGVWSNITFASVQPTHRH